MVFGVSFVTVCTWTHHGGCTRTSTSKSPPTTFTPQWSCSWRHAESQYTVTLCGSWLTLDYTRKSLFHFIPALSPVHEVNMTFRRLKKVNSSSRPESGPNSQENDTYFPSSKSDSCRTVDVQTNSSDVYNYKTLAYSGGTLPRSFKKVSFHHTVFISWNKSWMKLKMYPGIFRLFRAIF